MVNYYSAFIPKFAHIIAPLTDLLKGHPCAHKKKSAAQLQWSAVHQRSFDQVAAALASPPVLRIFDPACPSRVSADASGVALGGVLEQEYGGTWHPVAFYSRKLSSAEQHYTTRERECLAVKQCLVEWRHYLLGAPFRVRSDHQSLKWLQTQNVTTLSDRMLRWVEYFSLFDFNHEYLPGDENVLPDHLSRPVTEVLLVKQGMDSQHFDLLTLAVFLHDHQQVLPQLAVVLPVFAETNIQTEFFQKLRQAQAQDPFISTLCNQLQDPQKQPPATRMLYELHDGFVVVPEADGRKRIVVPDCSLQTDICKYFHDENGHLGVHRTMHAISTYFFWPNMGRAIRSYVASCQVCQTAKATNRLPGGISEPHTLLLEPGAHWTLDFWYFQNQLMVSLVFLHFQTECLRW